MDEFIEVPPDFPDQDSYQKVYTDFWTFIAHVIYVANVEHEDCWHISETFATWTTSPVAPGWMIQSVEICAW